MNVMVVDDSTAMRMIVIRTLRAAGFDGLDIVQAVDGADAFEKIQDDKPDVVLADWNMPNMTGIELLQAINEEGINLKLGFITTEQTSEMKDLAKNEGASFMIAKPFNADSFRRTLDPIFNG